MRLGLFACVLAVAAFSSPARAGLEQPLYVIDSPTAGLLNHGEFLIQNRLGPESAIATGVRLGIKQRIQLGVSFGMQRVLERADIEVNDQVGFQLRVRLVEELTTPAVAIGFNSQGTGPYDEDLERYERKSYGFFLALSKNWLGVVGNVGLHGGVNYSTETDDDDDVNVFVASDWEIGDVFAFLLDANAAINDDQDDGRYGEGGVYLDGGLRVRYGQNLSLMLIFRDLTNNFAGSDRVGRELEITFVDLF